MSGRYELRICCNPHRGMSTSFINTGKCRRLAWASNNLDRLLYCKYKLLESAISSKECLLVRISFDTYARYVYVEAGQIILDFRKKKKKVKRPMIGRNLFLGDYGAVWNEQWQTGKWKVKVKGLVKNNGILGSTELIPYMGISYHGGNHDEEDISERLRD